MSETKPNDTKPSEVKPRKVVGRNVAIALGIICIVLVAGLGVVIYMGYSPTASSSTTSLQSQINDLNSTYKSYVSTHSHTNDDFNSLSSQLQNQISSLNDQITSLQNQVNDLTNTLSLGKSTIWVNNQPISEPASSYVAWNFAANYAGYLSVWVQTSSSTTTYVRVIYSSNGVNYDNEIKVGTGGTAVFPILPCGSIEVRVGNTNLITGHTQTVTITYHY